jgi:hypothetical protein
LLKKQTLLAIVVLACLEVTSCKQTNSAAPTSAASAPSTPVPQKYKMTTSIPPEITVPDSVETRLGTLKYFDGLPDKETVQKVYDNLDFQRAVEVFLDCQSPASLLINI